MNNKLNLRDPADNATRDTLRNNLTLRLVFMGYVYFKTGLRVQILGYWKQKKNLAFEKLWKWKRPFRLHFY